MLRVKANSFIHCEGKSDLMTVANQQIPGSNIWWCVCVRVCQDRLSGTPHQTALPGQSEMDYPHAFWQDKHTNSVIRYLSPYSGKC